MVIPSEASLLTGSLLAIGFWVVLTASLYIAQSLANKGVNGDRDR